MRVVVGVIIAALLSVAGPAGAEESSPLSLGVSSGVIAGSGPWRAAPTINLTAGVPVWGSRLSLIAGLGGWTFASIGPSPSRTEFLASAGLSLNGSLSEHWSWLAAASPALTIMQASNSATAYRPGLLVSPALEYSTRRKTLGLTLGTQALLLGDGLRVGATAGVVYTFR